MMVTDKQYSLETKLVQRLDNMIKRNIRNKADHLIIIDGDEGTGKSTLASMCAYYISYKMNKPFSVDNVFFDLDKMLKFASETANQVIVWDEAAISALAAEWYKKEQTKLLKFLMVARKKGHFYFFCIPRFYKLNQTLAVDRSVALIHTYARKQIQLGRFFYYRKSDKEALYEEWTKRKAKRWFKYRRFGGTFSDAMARVLDYAEYDKRKDEAIKNILKEKERVKSKREIQLEKENINLKLGVTKMPQELGVTQKQLAKSLNVAERTIREWKKSLIDRGILASTKGDRR